MRPSLVAAYVIPDCNNAGPPVRGRMTGISFCGSMFDDARCSSNFCWVRDGGKSVGVLVPERRDCDLECDACSGSVMFGANLFHFCASRSPLCAFGELCDGRKLLSFGVPADPSPSMKRETRSLPGVSARVDP